MPRILFLASTASTHTARWVNAIAESGFDVHLLSLDPVGVRLDPGMSLYHPPFPPKWGYIANGPWLRRLIAQVQPDLVHAHYATGYGTLAALSGFHPTILSVWGMDVFEFPHQSALHKALLEFNLSSADKVLSTSLVMAKEINRYTDRVIEVTPFGIDLDRFKPEPVAGLFDPGDVVIGTVKTLEKKYGIEYLIRAFGLLYKRHPGLPLRLLVVGRGSQQAELERLTKELGVAEDTVFTGWIDHDQVPKYQNMLTISVSVSVSDSESFGVAVLEASACEKPVVVSNVGGLPEVVEDGVTGILVEPRNVQQTADAIERLVLDPALRVSMGQAGRDRVRRLYDWEDSVRQMLRIYEEILCPPQHDRQSS